MTSTPAHTARPLKIEAISDKTSRSGYIRVRYAEGITAYHKPTQKITNYVFRIDDGTLEQARMRAKFFQFENGGEYFENVHGSDQSGYTTDVVVQLPAGM